MGEGASSVTLPFSNPTEATQHGQLPDFARELEGAEAAERAFAELSAFVVPGLEAPAPGLRKV